MPRTRNPDPNGYLMALAEKRAENEVEDKPSIAQLLDRKGLIKPGEKLNKTDEAEGEQTATEQSVETNTSPGKTLDA